MKRLSPLKTKLGHYDDDSKAYIVTVIADYIGLRGVFGTWFGLNRASEKWKIRFFFCKNDSKDAATPEPGYI